MTKERLEEARRDLNERGFCVSYGDLHCELQSATVPLQRHGDSSEAYFSGCTVPTFELEAGQLLEEVGPRLTSLARSKEAALNAPQMLPV